LIGLENPILTKKEQILRIAHQNCSLFGICMVNGGIINLKMDFRKAGKALRKIIQ
jgi:hypothetical protein